MIRERRYGLALVGLVSVFGGLAPAGRAETVKLTVTEAVQLALRQNRALKLAQLKVTENEYKKAAARSGYFPEVRNESRLLRTTAAENIQIPRGAFGVNPIAGPIPASGVQIDQGAMTLLISNTTLAQPLTPLIRIHQANRIASSEIAISRDDLKKAQDEVALQVHTLYYGILIAQLEQGAAEQESVYAASQLEDSLADVRNGSALRVAAIQSQAGVLQSRQAVLTASLRLSDLTCELNELLGLPLDTVLELSHVSPASLQQGSREEYLRTAFDQNPQIRAAMEVVQQAKAGVTAAKSAYIPDVSVFARQNYQNGVPFLVHNFGTFGISLAYDLVDFGKRRSLIRERETRLEQAQENLKRLKDSVSVQIERSYNKVERTRNMMQVASEVLKLRSESERLAENQVTHGVVLVSARLQASAARYQAQAGLLQVQLAHLLAIAELEQTVGRTPGL